ncbi:unnamed protein product [Moneuplotes crassus]|uniref:Secreted protein n=1 Tax=Euplotes crassus TaxID=5936 RepID=A0AAD1Y8A3_EUPCR|nr:unnamed protein product [Moneuplotes crassus]
MIEFNKNLAKSVCACLCLIRLPVRLIHLALCSSSCSSSCKSASRRWSSLHWRVACMCTLILDFEHSSFYFCEVQDVFNKTFQNVSRRCSHPVIFGPILSQVVLHQVQRQRHRIEGSPELVGHIREHLALIVALGFSFF